jgi:hypothetical protein
LTGLGSLFPAKGHRGSVKNRVLVEENKWTMEKKLENNATEYPRFERNGCPNCCCQPLSGHSLRYLGRHRQCLLRTPLMMG